MSMSNKPTNNKMFFQPPDDEPNYSKNNSHFQKNPRDRRQKKLRHKNKQKAIKKHQLMIKSARSHIPITMSSWAEAFTSAATWQLKHQVAFWKSKATALEYENKLLHDVIRKNYLNTLESENNTTNSDHESMDENSTEFGTEVEDNDDGDLEVTDEFIEFLKANKPFQEDARRERERMRALYDTEQLMINKMEAGPSENAEDPKEGLKKLYGDGWEKISALEASLQSQFIDICDREQPIYWPNIPFNLG